MEGYRDTYGGYHEYCGGCSVPWGINLLLFEYLNGTEHHHCTHDIGPHLPEHSHGTHDIHTVLTHDIPHGTEHPHSTQDAPHIYHDIPGY